MFFQTMWIGVETVEDLEEEDIYLKSSQMKTSKDLLKAVELLSKELAHKMRPKAPSVFVFDKPLKPRYWKR